MTEAWLSVASEIICGAGQSFNERVKFMSALAALDANLTHMALHLVWKTRQKISSANLEAAKASFTRQIYSFGSASSAQLNA